MWPTIEEGDVTQAEADAMTVPTYLRRREDIEAPFRKGTVEFAMPALATCGPPRR